MVGLRNERTATGAAAKLESPFFQSEGNGQLIAVAFVNLGNSAYGATDGTSALLPIESPMSFDFERLAASLGASFGVGATSGAVATVSSKAEGTASERIAEFAKSLRREKSEKTAQGYMYDVQRVLKSISEDAFGGKPLDELDLSLITLEQVEQAEQRFFTDRDIKLKTQRRLKQGWNSFCTFIKMPVWKFSKTVNEGRKYNKEVISNADVEKMLNFCMEQREATTSVVETERWFRREIAIRLGFEMGFRSCEYGNATFDDVKGQGIIYIRGSKANGCRDIPVTQDTNDVIMAFKAFLEEHKRMPKNGGIFEKADGKNYSTSTFRRWMKKVAEGCGVDPVIAKTHGLRHRFGRNFQSNIRDDIMQADIMGHKSIDTTRQYTQPTYEEQRSAMQKSVDKVRRQQKQQSGG